MNSVMLSSSHSLLLKPSIVKPIVATVEKRLVLRKLGRLQEADLQALRDAVETILGG